MSIDLAASLRRLKPEKRTAPLSRRLDHDLSFVGDAVAGSPLLLDTTVYIDALQDRLPQPVANLLRVRQITHSSIAVAELSYGLGRLEPAHPATSATLKVVRQVIADIPAHRLTSPSSIAIVEAGIVAGMMARLQGLSTLAGKAMFNDCVLLLHALEQGALLLSRNISDLDRAQQLVPSGRVLFYRRSE